VRVVISAVKFGRLDSIPTRSRIEKELTSQGIRYEAAQTAFSLNPLTQVRMWLRRQPPFLYFLVASEDVERATAAVIKAAPDTLEK